MSQSSVCTSLSCLQHYTSQDPLVTLSRVHSRISHLFLVIICFTCSHPIMFDYSVYLVPSVLINGCRSMLNVTSVKPRPPACMFKINTFLC